MSTVEHHFEDDPWSEETDIRWDPSGAQWGLLGTQGSQLGQLLPSPAEGAVLQSARCDPKGPRAGIGPIRGRPGGGAAETRRWFEGTWAPHPPEALRGMALGFCHLQSRILAWQVSVMNLLHSGPPFPRFWLMVGAGEGGCVSSAQPPERQVQPRMK